MAFDIPGLVDVIVLYISFVCLILLMCFLQTDTNEIGAFRPPEKDA